MLHCTFLSPVNFSDVSPDSPYDQAIAGLADAGIISGYGDCTFRPYSNLTTGQLAKIAVLAFGASGVSENSYRGLSTSYFSDVNESSPFASYIEIAGLLGWISGYPDGTFRPDVSVTRGQLAKIVVMAGGLTLSTPAQPTFSDVAADSPFYAYVETAYANGLVSGHSGGTFQPQTEATRGQVCKMIYKVVGASADAQK